jgi:ubiquinone/menaquinone biosynthesis C-methylase UbiE
MEKRKSNRTQNEILHGKTLADSYPEVIWGWELEAGKIRALRRAKLINVTARLKSDTKVLEIGCGTGIFTKLLAETQANIIAVDISPDLLNIARRKKYRHKNVSFINKSFEDCRKN